MGCNCGKSKRENYVLTLPDGTSDTYRSQKAAQTAKDENGGKGTITKVRG